MTGRTRVLAVHGASLLGIGAVGGLVQAAGDRTGAGLLPALAELVPLLVLLALAIAGVATVPLHLLGRPDGRAWLAIAVAWLAPALLVLAGMGLAEALGLYRFDLSLSGYQAWLQADPRLAPSLHVTDLRSVVQVQAGVLLGAQVYMLPLVGPNELVFRGAMLDDMPQGRAGRVASAVGWAVIAVAVAAVWSGPGVALLLLVPHALAMGVVLAGLRAWTGSVWPGAVLRGAWVGSAALAPLLAHVDVAVDPVWVGPLSLPVTAGLGVAALVVLARP